MKPIIIKDAKGIKQRFAEVSLSAHGSIVVQLVEFKGELRLEIRYYDSYKKDDEKIYPTQKGVTIPQDKVVETCEAIEAAFKAFNEQLQATKFERTDDQWTGI